MMQRTVRSFLASKRASTQPLVSAFSTGAAGTCDAPLVSDSLVTVTVVDYKGNRRIIQGRTGESLLKACQNNGVEWLKDDSNGGGTAYSVIRNEDFTEELFGEGPVSPVSHVVVANEWFSKLPPLSHREQTTLNTIPPEEQTPTSRLGTEIILNASLNNLVVAIPESPPGQFLEHIGEEVEVEEVENEEHNKYFR